MAGVTPSLVDASDVNAEIGVSTTQLLTASNNWVRNVAAIPNGTTQINFGKLRWGINFPGRRVTQTSNSVYYSTANTANLTSFSQLIAPTGTSNANVVIDINSDGILKYISSTLYSSGLTAHIFNRTWLTSGTNADYTANMVLSTGSFDATSAATSTDLALSSNRRWRKSITRPSGGTSTATCSGVLIVKNDGVEIFRRPWIITVTADFIQI